MFRPMERLMGMGGKRITAMAVIGAIVVAGVGGATPVASQGVGLGEGAWRGSLSYNALVVFDDDIPASYYGRGTFLATVSGGSVEGSFIFNQLTVVRPPDLAPAVASADVFGNMTGGALAPELVYDEILVTSTSLGITAELTFTAAELGSPSITMVPTAGGCGSVSGVWNQEFASGLGAQGEFIAGRQGTWVAHRNGGSDAPDADYEAAMADIEASAATLIEDLRDGGPWSADIVGDILGRAEQLAANGFVRSNCDSGEDDTAFRNRAYAVVAQMLSEAALSDGVLADGILELMVAGYRSGVFASDPELANFTRPLSTGSSRPQSNPVARPSCSRCTAQQYSSARPTSLPISLNSWRWCAREPPAADTPRADSGHSRCAEYCRSRLWQRRYSGGSAPARGRGHPGGGRRCSRERQGSNSRPDRGAHRGTRSRAGAVPAGAVARGC